MARPGRGQLLEEFEQSERQLERLDLSPDEIGARAFN